MPPLPLIPTGVPGLDTVLGGGLPALSFNVIGGDPGAGKTTLAHQILFHNATEDHPALFCTVMGEPAVKMLRYQEGFEFFDPRKVGKSVHYRNLTAEILEGDLEAVLAGIIEEVERLEPAFIAVDSFRSLVRMTDRSRAGARSLEHFVQRLCNEMTRWEATSFLIGEFRDSDTASNPTFTVADGVIWLRHQEEMDARVRRLSVSKMRGLRELPGGHAYRIGPAGLRVYPRTVEPLPPLPRPGTGGAERRLSTGVPGLDRMMHGGIPAGDAVIASGPAGCGKSILGMAFAAAGVAEDEPVVVGLFEETRRRYLSRADDLGFGLGGAEAEGRLRILRRQPLDLSLDETFQHLRDAAVELGAARVVVDSLSGLQVAAQDSETYRLRKAIGRVVQTLTEGGVTVLMMAEMSQEANILRFTPHDSSFLADDVILHRYVEVEGSLQSVVSVVKMRRSAHSRAFHRYEITDRGMVIGEPARDLRGIATSVPHGADPSSRTAPRSQDLAEDEGGDGG